MAMKPKKIMNVNRPENLGGGRGISNDSFGKGPKVAAKKPIAKKAAVKPNTTIKIKSGGDIKPATSKKTIASNPANVGRAPSPDRVKWDLETAKLSAPKGSKIKINTDPAKKGIFSPLKKKIASADTPANRAKAAAAARALKLANRNR